MEEILLATALFTGLLLILVLLILLAKAHLLPNASIIIEINGQKTFEVARGSKLLRALSEQEIFLPSACGGSGVCGQCKVKVLSGGGVLGAPELSHLSKQEHKQGLRLACQLSCQQPLRIELPSSVLQSQRWLCRLRSSRMVASFIKELVFELPAGTSFNFRAGAYVQAKAPPFTVAFADFSLTETIRELWAQLGLLQLKAVSTEPLERAYSLANYPEEQGLIILNVRIATPPKQDPEAQPGLMSSYLFSLQPGAQVEFSGPFGQFFAMDSQREMIFVGGGAGMAPMRSHIFDQLCRLNSQRTISFWYGARSRSELFYLEDFDKLQREHSNFHWQVALSDPQAGDHWPGPRGYIHQVLYDQYLSQHHAPEEVEYYLCGPPAMTLAVTDLLINLGVPREQILSDDFGA